MAPLLLAAFPVLMLFDTRFAWAALIAAIVMSVHKRMGDARRVARERIEHDASV